VKHILAALAFTLLAPSAPVAASLATMFPARALEQERPRYQRRLAELYGIILPALTSQERQSIAGVSLAFPLVGPTGTPFEFYTQAEVGRASVVLPVFSLLFLEDLATAFAWLQVHEYSLETVEEYVTMLRYKEATDFPGGRHAPPLAALRIPAQAITEERVGSLALSLRNEAYAFILLHELGHVRYRHPGYQGLSRTRTRANEMEADAFALTVLERTETIPMGIVLWFMAQVHHMPNKGQLLAEGKIRSEADWERHLATEQTHPLTTERLAAIARFLDQWAARAGPGNRGEVLAYTARRLARMSQDMSDPEFQGCLAAVARRASLTSLAPRRLGSRAGGTLMQEHCTKRR
jgi:hypothetical protein